MHHHTNNLLRKVPEITTLFWITKLLTTAMGEATSDFLANAISPYAAVAIGFIIFAAAITLQFTVKRYIPIVYWFTVAMVAVFGTMAADVLHKQFGIPYVASTALFAVCLTIIFIMWQNIEHSLSIHTITSRRREVFYWLTVITTFAFGTAAGDWTANSLGLGYLSSGILFALIIVVPAIGHRFHLKETYTFWFAYIITRPLGASFADWFGKPKPTGLGLGDGTVSLVLTVFIICCVSYMSFNTREKHDESTIQSNIS